MKTKDGFFRKLGVGFLVMGSVGLSACSEKSSVAAGSTVSAAAAPAANPLAPAPDNSGPSGSPGPQPAPVAPRIVEASCHARSIQITSSAVKFSCFNIFIEGVLSEMSFAVPVSHPMAGPISSVVSSFINTEMNITNGLRAIIQFDRNMAMIVHQRNAYEVITPFTQSCHSAITAEMRGMFRFKYDANPQSQPSVRGTIGCQMPTCGLVEEVELYNAL